jgi:thiamine biosynthesis lipoprotein
MAINRHVIILMALFVAGCAPHESFRRFEYTRLCMGVRTEIVLFSEKKAVADEAAATAFERLAQLDSILSDYRHDSELNRLCARAGSGPVAVSEDLFETLRTSLAVSRASDGAFDITIGPGAKLWRETRRTGALPDEDSLAAARALIDWRNIILDGRHQTVELKLAGMRLDLGGIGKGFAAQQAVELLKSRGFNRCLVALAGDIVVGDPPPHEKGWGIEIAEREASLLSQGASVLLISNAAVSTSGDVEQIIDINGTRYSHIIDPRTGLGITARRSVTVAAPRGEVADALASALCVLGLDSAQFVLDAFPGSAAIIQEIIEPETILSIIDPAGVLDWSPSRMLDIALPAVEHTHDDE